MSIFSEVLKGLLDDTQIFSREDWATVLGVEESAIASWVQDEALPPAIVLRSIVRVVKRLDGVKEEPVRKWSAIVDLPAREVTPFWQEMGKDTGNYMVRPCIEGFLRNLAILDPKKQEIMLLGTAEMVRTMSDRGPREWSPRMWKEWGEKMKKALDEGKLPD